MLDHQNHEFDGCDHQGISSNVRSLQVIRSVLGLEPKNDDDKQMDSILQEIRKLDTASYSLRDSIGHCSNELQKRNRSQLKKRLETLQGKFESEGKKEQAAQMDTLVKQLKLKSETTQTGSEFKQWWTNLLCCVFLAKSGVSSFNNLYRHRFSRFLRAVSVLSLLSCVYSAVYGVSDDFGFIWFGSWASLGSEV